MAKEKALQKFTDVDQSLENLLSQPQITPDDIRQFKNAEVKYMSDVLTEKLNNLSGVERDNFCRKIEAIVAPETKSQFWENNHIQITCAIANLMQEYGRMPSATEIAAQAKLSRQTVHKHLKEFTVHPVYLEQIDQFKFMASKVLAKVYKFAVNGDMTAAKLYFKVIGMLENEGSNPRTRIESQNNYIQINGVVLSQQTIAALSPQQLKEVETALKSLIGV